jgi:hypothetical protein
VEKHTGFFKRYDQKILTRRPLMWLTKLHIIGPVALVLIPLFFLSGFCRRLPLMFSSENLFIICGLLSMLCCIMLIWWQSRVKTRNLSSAQARAFALYSSVSYFTVILLCSAYAIGYQVNFSYKFDTEKYNTGLKAYHRNLLQNYMAYTNDNKQIIEALKIRNWAKDSIAYEIIADSTNDLKEKKQYADVNDKVKKCIYISEDDSYIFQEELDSIYEKDSTYNLSYDRFYMMHNTLNEISMHGQKQKDIIDEYIYQNLIYHLHPYANTEEENNFYNLYITAPGQTATATADAAKSFCDSLIKLPVPFIRKNKLIRINKYQLQYIDKNYIKENGERIAIINEVVESDFMLLFKITTFLLLFFMVCSQAITSAINNVEVILSILCASIIGSIAYIFSLELKFLHQTFSLPQFLIIVAGFLVTVLPLFREVNKRPSSFIILFIIHLSHFIFIYILFLGGLALVERLVYAGYDSYAHQNRNIYLITTFISLPLCFLLHYFFIKKYNKLFHLPKP